MQDLSEHVYSCQTVMISFQHFKFKAEYQTNAVSLHIIINATYVVVIKDTNNFRTAYEVECYIIDYRRLRPLLRYYVYHWLVNWSHVNDVSIGNERSANRLCHREILGNIICYP
jgi:hypothetical protein